MNKVDYMCFTRLHKRKIHPIPRVILPYVDHPGGMSPDHTSDG